MMEIQSLPQSLKAQLEHAQNLLDCSAKNYENGYTELARSQVKEGMSVLTELAQRTPDLASLVIGVLNGHRQLEMTTIEESTRHEVVVELCFGKPFRNELVPVTDRKVTTRILRFS